MLEGTIARSVSSATLYDLSPIDLMCAGEGGPQMRVPFLTICRFWRASRFIESGRWEAVGAGFVLPDVGVRG